MPELLPPSIAIAIATIENPSSANDADRRRLIGVAVFEAKEPEPGALNCRYGARIIPAGASESELINWLTSRLPEGSIAIGWRLAANIIPTLLQASDAATPEDAQNFVDALAALVSIDAVDLADRDDVGGRSFSDLCAEKRIRCSSMTEDDVFAGWTLGLDADLERFLATNVVATWQLWARAMRPDDTVLAYSAQALLASWLAETERMAPLGEGQGGE